MTTVLSIVQDFTERLGLPTPSALVGVTESSVRQYRALLNQIAQDLAEYRWQQQKIRGAFTATAASDQGLLTDLFGAGYSGLVPDSMWNETKHIRVYGPVSDAVWQALQTLPTAGPEYQAWVSGNHLYLQPAPAVTDVFSAVYITKDVFLDVDGLTTKSRLTADDDSFLFPDNVVSRALEYKWRKQKGEAGWEDDYNAYIGLLAKNIVRDGAPTFQMDSPNQAPRPGIVIPPGSWNV